MTQRRTIRLVLLVSIFLLASVFGVQAAQWVDEYQNPLDVSCADPSVLKDNGTYYMYPTGWDCFASTNLVDWQQYIWAYYPYSGDTRTNFWAPEVIKRPSDGKYLRFYCAQAPGAKLKVYVAQSTSPTSGFSDISNPATPLFDTNAGDAWIDPNPFIDTNGQAYMYVVKDLSSDSGRPDRGAIFVATINLDTLAVGALTRVLSPNTTGWEARPDGAQNEGPCIVKHNSQYFLLYSGNGAWTSNYAVGYAVSTSPTSGFVKYSGNPILKTGLGLPGPGHCAVTTSPDGKEYFIVYHAKTSSSDGWDRQLCVDRMNFLGNPGAESIQVFGIKGSGGTSASCTPQLLPSNSTPRSFCPSYDAFDSLNRSTWSIMGENPFNWTCSGGSVNITSTSGDFWAEQSGISNLFLAPAWIDDDWQVTAKVTVNPTVAYQQAFLVIWQDQNNYVRLADVRGSSAHQFQIIKEEGGTPSNYFVANSTPTTKWIRIVKDTGHFSFYASSDGTNYTALGSGYDAGFITNRKLKLGFGCICPDGAGGSAPAITANFQDIWYDRLATYSPGINDEFNDNALDRRIWVVHNEDQTMFGEEGSAYLRIRTQDGDWANARTDLRNVFLQSAKSGDWTISTSVKTPTIDGNYDQASIIVMNNHNNFIKLSRAYIGGCKLEAGVETNGTWSSNNVADPVAAGTYEQLRIRKVGTTYYCERSSDGTTWYNVGTKTASWTPMFVGIGASSPGAAHQHDYYFDWFHVN